EAAGLFQDRLERAAPQISPQFRNDAERAAEIAAVGDPEVGEVARRGNGAMGREVDRRSRRAHLENGGPALADAMGDAGDGVDLPRSDDRVDLRNLPEKLRLVALREAAGHDQPAQVSFALQGGQL